MSLRRYANHVIGAAKLGVAGNCNKTVYLPQRKAALDQWGARWTH